MWPLQNWPLRPLWLYLLTLTHSAPATPTSLLPFQHLGSFLPQGLCTGCSLCLKHSSLRASHSWRFLILHVSAQMSPPLRSPSSLPPLREPKSLSIIIPHFLSFKVICQHLKSSFLLITSLFPVCVPLDWIGHLQGQGLRSFCWINRQKSEHKSKLLVHHKVIQFVLETN